MKKRTVGAAGLLLVAGLVYVWSQSSWLDNFNADRNQEYTDKRDAGLAFGQNHNQNQCLTQALKGFNECTGYTCTIGNGKFLKACLETAEPSADFCDGVPAYQEDITEDEKTWARHTCWDLNIASDGCRLLLRQKQFFCQ